MRVPKVPASRINGEQLGQIKQVLAKRVGKPSSEIEQEIAQRAKDYGVPYYLKQAQASVSDEREEEVWQ